MHMAQENVMCAVVGIPKSIDNDILLVDRCFGFDTAVEEAQRALLAAKVEASSADHGIGLVKLMGRSSGFIALQVPTPSALLLGVCMDCTYIGIIHVPDIHVPVDIFRHPSLHVPVTYIALLQTLPLCFTVYNSRRVTSE
jgi:hypothetical protein